MSSLLYAQAQNATHRLRIFYDDAPESPRKYRSTLGTMVCWHGRYDIGDDHDYQSPQDFLEDVPADTVVRLPVFLLDHSGLRLSTGSFGDPWDSGQVGWIFARLDQVRDAFNVDQVTPAIRARAEGILRSEVEEYSHYLSGDVFGYMLERAVPCGCDLHCACPPTYTKEDESWGFYGSDFFANGMSSNWRDVFPEYTHGGIPLVGSDLVGPVVEVPEGGRDHV